MKPIPYVILKKRQEFLDMQYQLHADSTPNTISVIPGSYRKDIIEGDRVLCFSDK